MVEGYIMFWHRSVYTLSSPQLHGKQYLCKISDSQCDRRVRLPTMQYDCEIYCAIPSISLSRVCSAQQSTFPSPNRQKNGKLYFKIGRCSA